MIKLHKKVVSGVLVELAVFGGVFQCKGIAAQAEGKVLQEERYLSKKQKRDLSLKNEIKDYIKLLKNDRYEIVSNFYGEGFYSKGVNSFNDFLNIEHSLIRANCLLHVGSVHLYIRVK